MTKKISLIFSAPAITFAGLLFIATPISVVASTDCHSLKGCQKKFCEIEMQIKTAQENDNDRKEDGLKKALSEAKKHCTDNNLKNYLVKEIEEINEEIAEYESDLKEAEEYGKTDKVHKYQEKINEETNKINRLKNELSDLN